MCDNECISKGKCEHNEECYDDLCFTSEQLKIVERWLAEIRSKTIEEEPRIKAFSKIYDICDDMIHETEWYDVLARQKFDEIKRIVFDCVEQIKEQKNNADTLS